MAGRTIQAAMSFRSPKRFVGFFGILGAMAVAASRLIKPRTSSFRNTVGNVGHVAVAVLTAQAGLSGHSAPEKPHAGAGVTHVAVVGFVVVRSMYSLGE